MQVQFSFCVDWSVYEGTKDVRVKETDAAESDSPNAAVDSCHYNYGVSSIYKCNGKRSEERASIYM